MGEIKTDRDRQTDRQRKIHKTKTWPKRQPKIKNNSSGLHENNDKHK